MKETEIDVAVIGGGLAGLISSTLLAKAGREVLLVEKKTYPFHRVCGEYISKEVVGFLKREGLFPDFVNTPDILFFEFSDTRGKKVKVPLDLGGFGISRYVLDEWLFQKAKEAGVQFRLGTQVSKLDFDQNEDRFQLNLSDHAQINARYVIGAFGKRSKLDHVLKRSFVQQRSPYIGVKYHVKTDFVRDTVALHNFEGGYCGLNAIEEGKFNLCYLGSRDQLRHYGTIEEMEQQILWQNPILRRVFLESDFLFDKPEVINEINFEPKQPVEHHMLMAGDSAGLITPLCGNGMAMAIHSGKLAAEALISSSNRQEIESRYRQAWNAEFRHRLWVGRTVQRLFGTKGASIFAGKLLKHVPFFAQQIIKNTHGVPF